MAGRYREMPGMGVSESGLKDVCFLFDEGALLYTSPIAMFRSLVTLEKSARLRSSDGLCSELSAFPSLIPHHPFPSD